MRSKKFQKSINKTEDLPSFLLNLKDVPDNVVAPRPKKSIPYWGPLFFGECLQSQLPHYSIPLSSFERVPIFTSTKEKILKDIFLPKSDAVNKSYVSKTFHPVIQHRKVYADPYPHKCPGVRKVFAPDTPLSEGLGETESIIEGEASREIPFYRVKQVSSACNPETSKAEVEIVTLSDIREEKRLSMSEKERMAHAHFPKEFVTVRVIGPTIPEAITITKLPTKRQTSFEIDMHLKSKAKTSSKKVGKGKESLKEEVAVTEKEKEESKESVLSLLMKKESSLEERSGSDNKREQSEEFEEESGHQQSQIIKDKEDEDEGAGEALEDEAGERGEEKENSRMFVDEEREGSLGDVEEEKPDEAAED